MRAASTSPSASAACAQGCAGLARDTRCVVPSASRPVFRRPRRRTDAARGPSRRQESPAAHPSRYSPDENPRRFPV
ncbi:hypothetical protein MYA_4175 [Burkholderia sp. KJ006]|nr:hypothetical protein MYA_4175 [Burkholderia sp. KJ006]